MSAPGRLPPQLRRPSAARARTAWTGLALAVAVSCCLLVASSARPGSQTEKLIAISEQQAILEDALKGALTDLARDPKVGPDALKQFRALCVGSWCCGKASPLSDLDITFDHPDKQIAERISNSVKQRIEAAVQGKGGHKIKVTFAGDPNFKEFFTGESGQSFIHEYALRNSPGGRATYTPVIQDGAVEFEMRSASEFWTGVGKPVPKKFSGVSTFVDESGALLESARSGNALEDAFAAAKYLNNVETIVKPGFSNYYGVALPPSLQLDETTKYQMREIMKLKGDTALTTVEKEARLRTLLGAEDAAQLEKKLGEFVAKSQEYFKGTSQRMAFFEDVLKSGGLRNAANAAEALTMAEKLVQTARKYGAGVAFGAIDAALLVNHYSKYGADQAFFEQLALSGAMYGMPPAAITAMLGAVAKEVVRAAGEYAVNAFIFDAINDAMIQSAYNPQNAWYLFSSDLGGNPFRGYSRMTLACKYLGNKSLKGDPMVSELEPLLADDVDKYVGALSAWRGLSGFTFGDMGPADIRGRLLPYLMADLKRSRDAWQAMGARETNLYANATTMFPAKPAVAIWVNGVPLEQRTHPAFTFDATPGKQISVVVDVRREFARALYRSLPAPGGVQAKWCECNGDWNRYLQWEKATLKEQESFENCAVAGPRGAVRARAAWLASEHHAAFTATRRLEGIGDGGTGHGERQRQRPAAILHRHVPGGDCGDRPGQGTGRSRFRVQVEGHVPVRGRELRVHDCGAAAQADRAAARPDRRARQGD